MNRKRDLIQIEEAYDAVVGTPPGLKSSKQQLKPSKAIDKTYEVAGKQVKTKMPAAKAGAYSKGFVHDNSGPEGADNFKSTELDPDNPSIKDDNAYDVKQMSDEGADTYFKAENKKIAKENINNDMAKNKSIFDRLYEEVMDDEQFDAVELGIGDDEGGDEVETDEVTITIDRDLATKFHEALAEVVGGETEAGDDEVDMEAEGELGEDEEAGGFDEMEEDEDEQDYGHQRGDSRLTKDDRKGTRHEQEEDEDEESFNYFGEEIEAEDLGHPLVNQKEGNPTPVSGSANVVKTQYTSKVGSKGGDGKVTDKVGDDGEEGTPLVNQRKGNPTSPKGTANVVKSKYTSKGANQEFFQKNG